MNAKTASALSLLLMAVLFAGSAQAQQANPWTFLGPQPISNQSGTVSDGDGYVGPRPIAGRVSAIIVANDKTIYIGTSGGGVWKSTDGGMKWSPKTDFQPSLSIGALAFDPTDEKVIYAGTGEFIPYYDEYNGVGILRSADAGETWTLLPDPNGVFGGAKVARIAVDPAKPQNIYAATNRGLAFTTNKGQSWQTLKMGGCSQISDVIVDNSTTPSTIYAASGPTDNAWYATDSPACNGVWKSQPANPVGGSAGLSFSRLSGGIPAGNMMRLAIQRLPKAGTTGFEVTLYLAMQVYIPNATSAEHQFDLKVFKSTDAGNNWTLLGTVAEGNWACYGVSVRRQFSLTHVSKSDALYVLSDELFASTDSGTTWQNVTSSMPDLQNKRKVHHDLHGFEFYPGSAGKFFLGTDGGIYKSEDYGQSFKNLNQTLGNVHFYRGAVSNTPEPYLIGSMHDSGFVRLETPNPAGWRRVDGGDGGSVVWDPKDSKRVYLTRDGSIIVKRSTDAGFSFQAASNGLSASEPRAFLTPLIMEPGNPKHLFVATNRLYESTDGADSWHIVGNGGATVFPQDQSVITAIATTAGAPATYVARGEKVFKFANAAWTNVTFNLANFWEVSALAVNPNDPSVVYAGLAAPSGKIHLMKLLGNNWVNQATNLPDANVKSIVIQPEQALDIFAATDQGVYRSTNGGGTWFPISAGLPNAVAYDVVLNQAGTVLYVFTHGRGVWRVKVNDLPVVPPSQLIVQPRIPQPVRQIEVRRALSPIIKPH